MVKDLTTGHVAVSETGPPLTSPKPATNSPVAFVLPPTGRDTAGDSAAPLLTRLVDRTAADPPPSPNGREGDQMSEFIVLAIAILVGGSGIVFWLNLRDQWAEKDRLERFQEAMRAGGRDTPLPENRED